MITKFDSLYAGHVDLDNVGYAGTPINDRRYDNAHLATALEKAQSMAVLMDGLGYNAFWMAEHHFQREGTECIPNVLLMALHLTHVTKNLKIGCGFNITPMWHPLRLAEDYAMADILSNGRVIFGLGRGYHTREVETFGSPLMDQEANRELYEEQTDIIFKAFNNESFSHKGKHYTLPPEVPYRGYTLKELTLVPRPLRLPVETWQPIQGGSARALEFMAKHGIQGMVGGGSAEGGAMHKVVLGWQEAHAKQGKHIELGERLCFGFHFYMADSKADGIRRGGEILRREHEDVRRAAPGPRDDRRADRDHARSEARAGGEAAADRGRGERRRLPDRLAGSEIIDHLKTLEEKYPALDRISVSLSVGVPKSEALEQLQRFAEEVMPAFRKAKVREPALVKWRNGPDALTSGHHTGPSAVRTSAPTAA